MSNGLFSLVSTPRPSLALGISAATVRGVAVGSVKSIPQVIGHSAVSLPQGAVEPGAAAVNITDGAVVSAAIREAIGKLPRKGRRVGLVVPDCVGKVSFLRLDHVPGSSKELRRLIAWQVSKALPFPIEDAQLEYAPGQQLADGGREFIVGVIRRDIVEEYERVCREGGVYAGLVDLSAFNVVNMATPNATDENGDWILVHIMDCYSTVALVRGANVVLLRTLNATTADDVSASIHQSVMFYEDRLKGDGISRAVLVQSDDSIVDSDVIARRMKAQFNFPVERLGSRGDFVFEGVEVDAVEALAGPVGLLLREGRLSS
tara:strand:- start:35815 stop:36768 length:954 start_codon:yes stop_codon:yes gene_type:complete